MSASAAALAKRLGSQTVQTPVETTVSRCSTVDTKPRARRLPKSLRSYPLA